MGKQAKVKSAVRAARRAVSRNGDPVAAVAKLVEAGTRSWRRVLHRATGSGAFAPVQGPQKRRRR